MTRKLLLLLPLVSLLPLVTGCRGERPAPDSVVLMLPATGQELQVWQDAIDAFTEASKIKVTLQSQAEGDYYAKLQKLIAGGSAPDLVAVDSTRFPELLAAGSLEPIDQFIRSQEELRLSDFYPWAIHSFQSQGSTYGLPVNVRVQALACDMDSFELAMKPRPTADWNWQQFADLAKAMTRDGENGVPVYGAALGPWWQVFVWQNGGELVDNPAAPTRSTLNTPQAIEALQFLADLTNKQKVAAPFATTEDGPANTIAAKGAALAMVDRPQVPRLDKVQEMRFELVPLPKGKVAANLGLTTGLCLVKGSKRQAEALKLLAYLGGLDGQKQLTNAGAVVPTLEVLAGSEYFAGGDPSYPFKTALKVARQLPTTPRYHEIEAVWAEELAPLWAGKATAAQVCPKIDERVNGILGGGR
ncbi:MAG: ABC transporter substrate-binding protein [Bacteroidota bacterium]